MARHATRSTLRNLPKPSSYYTKLNPSLSYYPPLNTTGVVPVPRVPSTSALVVLLVSVERNRIGPSGPRPVQTFPLGTLKDCLICTLTSLSPLSPCSHFKRTPLFPPFLNSKRLKPFNARPCPDPTPPTVRSVGRTGPQPTSSDLESRGRSDVYKPPVSS